MALFIPAGGQLLATSVPVLLPVPPNTEVTVSIARGDTSELETYFFTVTGRLVDVD